MLSRNSLASKRHIKILPYFYASIGLKSSNNSTDFYISRLLRCVEILWSAGEEGCFLSRDYHTYRLFPPLLSMRRSRYMERSPKREVPSWTEYWSSPSSGTKTTVLFLLWSQELSSPSDAQCGNVYNTRGMAR